MPNGFAQEPSGFVYIADGMGPMLKWDGLATQATTVGVLPPTTSPTITFTQSGTAPGTITGDYYAYVRFLDKDGNPSNLSPISAKATATNADTVTYTNVPVPVESKVVRKQILRNSAGQAQTFYVDVDTSSVNATTFISTNTDTQLTSQIAVPILNADGTLNANRYTVPPAHKAVIAHHLGRMFAAVDVEYRRGSCQVSNGSNLVVGIGTEWTSSMPNRFLYVVGAPKAYQIASVDPKGQTLTLTETYTGPTDNFAQYGIRPAPAERRLVYYSEAGLPEAWPAINAISIQEDGDEITGLMTKGSFLYILERRHIYRFTFQGDPATDGFVFLSSVRGCINHRCWVQAEDVAYMLDELGIHAFSGGQQSEPISSPVQGLFRPSDSPLRVNWRASKWFHASHYSRQETVRWFVSLGGDYLPHHAIVYDYRRKRWWIEQYPFPVGAAVEGFIDGQPKVFLGSEARKVFSLWEGALDKANPANGTVRGNVSSSSPMALSDASASFGVDIVGAPLSIVSGKGKGQSRIISSVNGTTLSITTPWLILPDATSVYQIGGVQWRFQSGDFRFFQSEQTTPRRAEVIFSQTVAPCTFDMRLRVNFSLDPVVWNTDNILDDGRGVSPSNGSPDLVVDMTKDAGFIQFRMDGHKDFYLDGARWVNIELTGYTNTDPVSVFGIVIDGVTQG